MGSCIWYSTEKTEAFWRWIREYLYQYHVEVLDFIHNFHWLLITERYNSCERYFGQKSFPMNEREYLEHLEAIGRYVTHLNKVQDFKDKIKQSLKRPNAYFGYAVSIPLDVDPSTADAFFKDLPYEWINSKAFSCMYITYKWILSNFGRVFDIHFEM